MSRSTRQRAGLAIAAAVVLASACTAAAPSSPTGAATSQPSTPDASVGASTTAVVSPTPVGTHATTVTPTAAASFDPAEPPPASLSVDGGDPVAGELGSFTWGDGGSDSPWLPGTPIMVGSGERLAVLIAGGLEVADWSARRVTAGTTDGSGAVGLGSGPPPVAFDAPPVGTWSVQVTVRFGGDLGSASYYWAVTVR